MFSESGGLSMKDNIMLQKDTIKSNKIFKGEWGKYIKHFDLMLMFLPVLIFFIIFYYLPMGGIVIAFKDYKMLDGILGSPWVGLDNFKRLFIEGDFLIVIRNTITISLLKLLTGFPVPIILAIMINELHSKKFKRLVQTITYIPYFFSWVVLGSIMIMLFSFSGPVNYLITALGLHNVNFLTDDLNYILLLLISAIWQNCGYGAIIYLAVISSIDPSYYESSLIDGAGRFDQIWHITLPCLAPTIITLLILNLGQILNAGFDQIFNTYTPMVYDVSDIIDTYVYRRLQTLDYSFGTAANLFKSTVGCVLILVTNKVANMLSDGEMGIF